MKYYVKDNTMYIKYISAIDGKLKTLEFDIIEDKEFLKNLMSQKNEETQIFMLDDTLREEEHPTDEKLETITIMKLTKPKKEDDKQQKYQFYKVKLEEQKARARDLEAVDKSAYTDEQKKEWEKQVKDTKARMEAYENEMRKLIKTDSDILSKPKNEEILTIEKILKGNIKDSNDLARKIIYDVLKNKGMTEEQIKDIIKDSKDIKDTLNKITLSPEEKKEITNKVKLILNFYNNIKTDLAYISNVKLPGFYELKDENIQELNNILNEYKTIFDLTDADTNYLIYRIDSTFPGKIKELAEAYFAKNNRKIYKFDYIYPGGYYVITRKNKAWIDNTKYTSEDKIIDLKPKIEDLEEFLNQYQDYKGMGLKDKIKKGITSDVDKKLNTLIKNFETLKNDYINFKQDMKTKMIIEKQNEEPKKETIKEVEIIKPKEEPKKEVKKVETVEEMKDEDFRDLIKNFSKNKLKHVEPVKYEPPEEKNLLSDTFDKRRKAFEGEEEENEEDDLEWDD